MAHRSDPKLVEKWALFARDAFSGVLLWKRPLTGFGEFEFEDAGPAQATVWNVWSSPLGLHRRAVVQGDRVFATLAYRGGLSALDAATGATVWEDKVYFSAKGIVCLNLADGKVYCLDAADGALVWRFRVAPAELMIVDDGRVASKWPVSGSLLVQDGVVFAPAGRSSFLDGGIQVAKLDVATGQLRGHVRLDGPWYLEEENSIIPTEPGAHGKATIKVRAGYYPGVIDAEGARSDLLVSDGHVFHMGSTQITPDLQTLSNVKLAAEGKPAGGQHLRAMTGFLDDTYYHRTGWHYSDRYYGGGNAAGAANAGKILVFDDRFTYASQNEGQDAGRYPNHLLGKGSTLNADAIGTTNEHKGFDVSRKAKPVWTLDVPLIVRAMLLAPGPGGASCCSSAGQTKPDARTIRWRFTNTRRRAISGYSMPRTGRSWRN